MFVISLETSQFWIVPLLSFENFESRQRGVKKSTFSVFRLMWHFWRNKFLLKNLHQKSYLNLWVDVCEKKGVDEGRFAQTRLSDHHKTKFKSILHWFPV